MLHLDVLNPTFVQGGHSGQGLGFVDFTSVVLPSAQFCFVDKMCSVVSDHHRPHESWVIRADFEVQWSLFVRSFRMQGQFLAGPNFGPNQNQLY